MKLGAFGFLLSSLVFAGCQAVSTPAETEETTQIVVDQPPAQEADGPPPPPSFSKAMENNLPQGVVEGAALVSPLPQQISDGQFDAASAYVGEMDSFSFLVWHDSALRHSEYFAPHTKDLRPETASMHKSVLSLLYGRAIALGMIGGENDPIKLYIPEWSDDPRGDITIKNLLQMSSGFEPLSYVGGPESEVMQFFAGKDVRATVLASELTGTPGDGFHYQNTVSQLLGLILENATEQPYETFLSQQLWVPLGADTAYVWYNEETGFPRTYSALLATAEDWMRVGLLVKNGGKVGDRQLVPEPYIEAMLTPSDSNSNYGYQIWFETEYSSPRHYNDAKTGFSVAQSEPFAVDDMVYFDGFGGQRVYISESLDLVIVRTGEVRPDWDDSKLPNLVIAALGN